MVKKRKVRSISRRDFLKAAGVGALAAGLGANIIIPGRSLGGRKKLKILSCTKSWIPSYQKWLDSFVKEWGEKKKRRLSRRSIDMALGTLRIILAHAKTLKIVTSNAVDDWKEDLPSRGRRRTSSPRKRITQEKVLEATEREQLLEAFQAKEPHCFPLVLFLAETGCRISEPLALTWEDVDLFRSLSQAASAGSSLCS